MRNDKIMDDPLKKIIKDITPEEIITGRKRRVSEFPRPTLLRRRDWIYPALSPIGCFFCVVAVGLRNILISDSFWYWLSWFYFCTLFSFTLFSMGRIYSCLIWQRELEIKLSRDMNKIFKQLNQLN